MNRRRKILITIGVVMIVALLAPVIRHYQLRAATNAYIAEIKAKGEPMDLAQVLPPHLLPEENSADTLRKAAALFKTDRTLLATNYYYAMKMVAPGKAMAGSRQPEARDYDVTNSWEEVAAALAENKAVFPLLWSFIEKPKFDFGINYDSGIADLNFTNCYLAESKRAALHLQVAALSALHRGDVTSAVKNVRAMLAIVKGMSDERLVISELVRIAIANIAMAATWETLQSTNVPGGQLAVLQSDWASLEFFRTEENALNMERASGAITLKKWRSSNSTLMNYFLMGEQMPWMTSSKSSATDRIRLMSRAVRWRYWWSYPDELRMLKGYQALLEAPRAAITNYALLSAQDGLISNVARLSVPDTDEFSYFSKPLKADLHFLLSSSIGTLARTFNKVIKVEIVKQLSTAAIALKCYHLKHGEYPPSLAALTPEFISQVPRDPIDGQPLRYRRNSDGTFQLYSIGDDGKDDGGDPTPSEQHKDSSAWQFGHDWVWPQPATAEEIQKFYEKPPK
jgi:hypothetical protein